MSGTVSAMFAGGGFVLAPGGYTVVMSPTTSIVNDLGHIVPAQFIATGGSVDVTGVLSGTTITATRVVVHTTIDF